MREGHAKADAGGGEGERGVFKAGALAAHVGLGQPKLTRAIMLVDLTQRSTPRLRNVAQGVKFLSIDIPIYGAGVAWGISNLPKHGKRICQGDAGAQFR